MARSPLALTRIHAILTVIALCVLTTSLARAQESFQATHITLFRSAGGVADSARGAGIGIFRADRASGTVDFRISLLSRGGAIGDVHIRHRTAEGTDVIVQSFVYPFNEITASSTLVGSSPRSSMGSTRARSTSTSARTIIPKAT
jgi:hypothetical protein